MLRRCRVSVSSSRVQYGARYSRGPSSCRRRAVRIRARDRAELARGTARGPRCSRTCSARTSCRPNGSLLRIDRAIFARPATIAIDTGGARRSARLIRGHDPSLRDREFGVARDYRYDPPMSRVVTGPMMVKWPDLMAEFDRWEEAGKVATLWWRDDDAVAPTARLDRLLSIASGVPVSLAVIPADAEQELAQWLADYLRSAPKASVAVLQHGWRHLNHSGVGEKERIPSGTPKHQRWRRELAAGRARLSDLFGTRAQPVLVPPWNRFDDSLLGLLARCGLTGISRARAAKRLLAGTGHHRGEYPCRPRCLERKPRVHRGRRGVGRSGANTCGRAASAPCAPTSRRES